MYDLVFLLQTATYDNGKVRRSLHKIVEGVPRHIKWIENYDEGREYLKNNYKADHSKVMRFTDSLCDKLNESIHLYHIDPFENTCTERHFNIDLDGEEIGVSVSAIVECELYVTAVVINEVNILDSDFDELFDSYIEEAYAKIEKVFNQLVN